MGIFGVVAGVIILILALIALFEYRIRQPDVLVLYESNGRIGIRKATIYPRHFSLPFKRTTCPIQLTVEATAVGNLGVRVKLVGSVALSPEHVESLIRIGGWNGDAVARAANEAQVLIEGQVKEYTEHCDVAALSSTALLAYLNERAALTKQQFGVELISLAVQSLEPTDPEVAESLRQQEQARLLEQTERLNNQARVAAAKAKWKADAEIAEMEHSLEMKRTELKKELLEREATLTHQRLEEELANNRLRLEFEREELDVLKSSPELLMLTPQAARLAEASQSLKSARTVISLAPQELAHGSEILTLFQELLQKALDGRKEG
jgi:hypothetical protein